MVVMSSRDSRPSSRASAPFRIEDLGVAAVPPTRREALVALYRLAESEASSPAAPDPASDTGSETEDGGRAGAATPKAKPMRLAIPVPSVPAAQVKGETEKGEKGLVEGGAKWHCRICLQDPCAAPMAAMCGHIFCTG